MDANYWASVIEPEEVGGLLDEWSEEDGRKDLEIQTAIKLLTDNGYVVIWKPF